MADPLTTRPETERTRRGWVSRLIGRLSPVWALVTVPVIVPVNARWTARSHGSTVNSPVP